MQTPALSHDFPNLPFPEKIQGFDYPSTMKVMKVCENGSIRWKSYYWVYLTAVLKGKYMGAEDQGNGIWRVSYR